MFKIEDGREQFYQWDIDRRLVIDDASIVEVHFCNRTDSCSLVCEVYDKNGERLVDVPNILLQTDWRINVYAYDGAATKHSATFKVNRRSKPADYIYTETEVKRYEDLENRIEALERNSGSGEITSYVFGVYFWINEDGTYSCDSTALEIFEAFTDGKQVQLFCDDMYTSYIFSLVYCDNYSAHFIKIDDEYYITNIWVYEDGSMDYYEELIPRYNNGCLYTDTPIKDTDAANKKYVDDAVKGGGADSEAVAELLNRITDMEKELANKQDKSGVYELIEQFTIDEEMAIERTQEPDGTPYKFVKAYVLLEATETGSYEGSFLMNYNNIHLGRGYASKVTTAPAAAVFETRQESGFWRGTFHDWKTNLFSQNALAQGSDRQSYPVLSIERYPYINRIYSAKPLPKGTTITIWGVRYNA